MHFFNPVPVLKLVEVIRTAHTSAETTAAIVRLAEELAASTSRRGRLGRKSRRGFFEYS